MDVESQKGDYRSVVGENVTGVCQVTFRPLECAALLRTSKRAEYSEIFSPQTCGWLKDRAVLLAAKATWVNTHPLNDTIGR